MRRDSETNRHVAKPGFIGTAYVCAANINDPADFKHDEYQHDLSQSLKLIERLSLKASQENLKTWLATEATRFFYASCL